MRTPLTLALCALILSACSSTDEPEKEEPKADPTPSATPTTEAPPAETEEPSEEPTEKEEDGALTAAEIKTWEKENALGTSDWADLVTKVSSTSDGLIVETKIFDDGDAKGAASPICGAYSTIAFEHSEIETITVLSKSGSKIAECGPGA